MFSNDRPNMQACPRPVTDFGSLLGLHCLRSRHDVQNLASVVTHILSTPNVTQQRDGRRDTPLMLARKRGLAAVEQALLQAGANDLPSSSPSAGRTAWSAGRSPVYIAIAIDVGSPSSDCGNKTPCDQVPDYSCLPTSRTGINAAASVTCLVRVSTTIKHFYSH